jgi:hypothetical protein
MRDRLELSVREYVMRKKIRMAGGGPGADTSICAAMQKMEDRQEGGNQLQPHKEMESASRSRS